VIHPVIRIAIVALLTIQYSLAEAAVKKKGLIDEGLALGGDVLLSTIEFCRLADIKKYQKAMPSFAEYLGERGFHLEPMSGDGATGLVNANIFEFGAWGLDAKYLPSDQHYLEGYSMFVEVKAQQLNGKTSAYCNFTDTGTYDPESSPVRTEREWLKMLRTVDQYPADNRTAINPPQNWAAHTFDLSNEQATIHATLRRYEVKIEYEIVVVVK